MIAHQSYKVLSLKYRPQHFEDVVGQDHITLTLQNAIVQNRFANGYLFTGPRGVGKTTCARLLAKAANCTALKNGDPCNKCTHCIEITDGRHLDVMEVDGASTRGIDAIRELREMVKYPPMHASKRVYIIDEVHMLTKEAFNALLKTLEEPPPHVMFIFATTEPHKVPPTIHSRCQRYDFKRIPMNTIIEKLNQISKDENINIPEDSLSIVARKGDGSMRDAFSLLDQVFAHSTLELTPETIRHILGILDSKIYENTLKYIINRDGKGLLTFWNDLLNNGIDINEYLDGLSQYFRDLLVVKIAGDASLLEMGTEESKQIAEYVSQLDERDILRWQNLLISSLREIKFVSNQSVFVELLLLKFVRMTPSISIETILNENIVSPQVTTKETSIIVEPVQKVKEKIAPPIVNNVTENTGSYATTKEITPPSTSSGKEILTDGQCKERWPKFIEMLSKNSPMVGTFLQEGELQGIENNEIVLIFSNQLSFQVDKLKSNISELVDVGKKVFNKKMKFIFKTDQNQDVKQREEDEILGHPTSQHIISLFDGEILNT
jgi:DNA polymerase III subunit gamma/tau